MNNFPGTSLELLAKGLYPGEKISTVKSLLHSAIKLDPKEPYLYYFLSTTYLHDGNFKTSLKFANKCLKLDPHFHSVLFVRVRCYYELNMLGDLVKDYFSLKCYIPNFSNYRLFESLSREWEEYKKSGNKQHLPMFYFPD